MAGRGSVLARQAPQQPPVPSGYWMQSVVVWQALPLVPASAQAP